MAVHRNSYSHTGTRKRQDNTHTHIKFFQLNLQHPRVATDNLVKLNAEQGTDIRLLQEPYTIRNKIVGIPKRQHIHPRGKQTRATIVTNINQIDILLIKWLSDSNTVVLEVTRDNAKIVLVSKYLDKNQHLHDNMIKMEDII